MTDLLSMLSPGERKLTRTGGVPRWLEPMLATLTGERFSDPGWLYERKLDGERALAFKDGDQIRLLSRNRKDLSAAYPELAEALANQPVANYVVDGEVVAFSGGVTSFSRLQKRMQISDPDSARASGVAVYYYLFDVLHVDGYRTDSLPLRRRKTVLQRYFDFSDPLRFTPHRNERGEEYHREACGKGWEGVIAKDAQAAYVHGRSRKWLKFKCVRRQELVIGGFTDPGGDRPGFGALLVGYYDGEELVYAGKVGTGYDEDTLVGLGKRLAALERRESPFRCCRPREDGVHFVSPELVAEVGFTEWTAEGRLRHPRFLGLRRDKEAREVVREETP